LGRGGVGDGRGSVRRIEGGPVEGSGRVVGRGMAPVRPDAVRPAMGKKGSQRWGMTPTGGPHLSVAA
jgi:hypothetical protein